MIKLQGTIPPKVIVCVSGGPDSMALLDFIKRHRDVKALFIDHGTEISEESRKIVGTYCDLNRIHFYGYRISPPPIGCNLENFWRKERLVAVKKAISLNNEYMAITAHHLDDCIEEYLINVLKRGRQGIIPYKHGSIIRPIRLTLKQDLIKWCQEKDVPYCDDPTNLGESNLRAHIRTSLRYSIEYMVNPGLEKLVRKMVLKDSPTENSIG